MWPPITIALHNRFIQRTARYRFDPCNRSILTRLTGFACRLIFYGERLYDRVTGLGKLRDIGRLWISIPALFKSPRTGTFSDSSQFTFQGDPDEPRRDRRIS